jgi:4-hydroxy-tetrahydrodipicolinate synthase
MLLLGADGIVPSAGNLVPDFCCELFASAAAGRRSNAEQLQKRMMEAAMLYQRGRTLGQSLAALKAAMSLKDLCGPAVLSPLRTLEAQERESIRREMVRLGLLPAPVALVPGMPAKNPAENDA